MLELSDFSLPAVDHLIYFGLMSDESSPFILDTFLILWVASSEVAGAAVVVGADVLWEKG